MLEIFGLLLTHQYGILILIDWVRGLYGWGIPVEPPWISTWFMLYPYEWICWLLIPIATMLWWRSWVNKHPELAEEI